MRTLIIRYACATATSLVLFFFVLGYYGFEESLTYSPIRELPWQGNPVPKGSTTVIDDIWFDKLGQLILLSHSGLDIHLQVRDSQGVVIPDAGWHLSLAEPEGLQVGTEAELRYSPKTLEPVTRRPGEIFFAVSADTKLVAWVAGDSLKASDFSESTPMDIAGWDVNHPAPETKNVAGVRRIAFAGVRIIALIREDGAFELWNLPGSCEGIGCQGIFGNQFGSARSLWPLDSGIVIASPRDLHIVKPKSADWAEVGGIIISDLRISALSVSRNGHIAVGTHDGIVALISGADLRTRTAFRLPIAQRIDNVAFFGQKLLVAGDFPGIYAVDSTAIKLVLPFKEEIDLLAADLSRIVIASNGRLWLSEVTTIRVPSPMFDRIVAVFSLYLSVLVAIFGFHGALKTVQGTHGRTRR